MYFPTTDVIITPQFHSNQPVEIKIMSNEHGFKGPALVSDENVTWSLP